MNNSIEKTYLALELTKISCDNTSNKELVQDTYMYHLKQLEQVDEIFDIKNLVENNNKLKKQIEELSKTNIPRKTIDELTEIVLESQGDMEPTVYIKLMNILRTYL